NHRCGPHSGPYEIWRRGGLYFPEKLYRRRRRPPSPRPRVGSSSRDQADVAGRYRVRRGFGGSGFERGEEGPDLIVDLGRRRDRGGDLPPEQEAVAAAEAMDGDAHGA